MFKTGRDETLGLDQKSPEGLRGEKKGQKQGVESSMSTDSSYIKKRRKGPVKLGDVKRINKEWSYVRLKTNA